MLNAQPAHYPATATEKADPGMHRLATALGANIETAMNLSAIEEEKAKLDGALVHIELQIEQLGVQLLPVLRPPQNVKAIDGVSGKEGAAPPEVAHAPMVHDLRYTTARLHRLAFAIEALQSRLAL